MLFFCFEEYPQVRPTNPYYTNRSTVKTSSSNARSSATLVNRRQKFDPQAPRRPNDWRWLTILCIILFFPLGMFIRSLISISSSICLFCYTSGLFAFAFARKAQRRFRDGFISEAHQLNKRALILSILSILFGSALIIGLLFGFDAWPRTNG